LAVSNQSIHPLEPRAFHDPVVPWSILDEPIAGFTLQRIATRHSINAEALIYLPGENGHRPVPVLAGLAPDSGRYRIVLGFETIPGYAPAIPGGSGYQGITHGIVVDTHGAHELTSLSSELDRDPLILAGSPGGGVCCQVGIVEM
jgi:hypothetical protein